MKLVRHASVESFEARALEWLLRAEAENNLLLGLIAQLKENHSFEDPIYLATVEDGDDLVGCAFRTPPYKLGLTAMPDEAAALVARDLFGFYRHLPAVMAPESASEAFASQWASLTGATFESGFEIGIYSIDEVIWPSTRAPGTLRPATNDDLERVGVWAAGFQEDAGLPGELSISMIKSIIDDGDLHLWVDGEPVSMLSLRGPTPNGVRISHVYTPPEHRGRGYASAAVALLTQRQFEAGKKFCFLYTDLANPTSNSIYRRLGYKKVGTAADRCFASPPDAIDD